jgi:hypothetical protein
MLGTPKNTSWLEQSVAIFQPEHRLQQSKQHAKAVTRQVVDSDEEDPCGPLLEEEVSTSAFELKWYHILSLVSLDILGPFSTDVFLPALSQLQHDLKTTQFLMSL